jgi:SAM-dependent methyltransferase
MSDITRLFGGWANAYANFRPDYPAALFDWMAVNSPSRQCALDIGCGNGQASLPLTAHFTQVLACDSSHEQLQQVTERSGLHLCAADACYLPVKSHSIDLLTVAQALHWFAGPAFFTEVQRVLKSGGLFCAWCYGLMTISPAIDALVKELHSVLLKGYWPQGRASVDAGYSDIQCDFPRIRVPDFAIELDWTFAQLTGYLKTWSAVQRWQGEHGRDPLELIHDRLADAWGDTEQRQFVRWPLHFISGYPLS